MLWDKCRGCSRMTSMWPLISCPMKKRHASSIRLTCDLVDSLLPSLIVYFKYWFHSNCIPSWFQANARELVISAFRDREKIVAIDESSLNMPTLSYLSNAQLSSNLLSESSYHQDSSSHNIGRSAYSQQGAFSPDFMQSLYPIGGLSNFDYYSHVVDPMEIRYDQPLSFPGQVTDSSICDTDSMARAFSANEHFKYLESDCSLQSPDLEISANAFIPCSVRTDKTPKRWNVLVWVLRWRSSIKRIVARKSRVRPIWEYHDAVGKYVSWKNSFYGCYVATS